MTLSVSFDGNVYAKCFMLQLIHLLLLKGVSSLDRNFLYGSVVLFWYFYFADRITVQ